MGDKSRIQSPNIITSLLYNCHSIDSIINEHKHTCLCAHNSDKKLVEYLPLRRFPDFFSFFPFQSLSLSFSLCSCPSLTSSLKRCLPACLSFTHPLMFIRDYPYAYASFFCRSLRLYLLSVETCSISLLCVCVCVYTHIRILNARKQIIFCY